MKLIYLAQPLDQNDDDTLGDWAVRVITNVEGVAVYRPGDSWTVHFGGDVDARLEVVNRAALNVCDALVAILPKGVPTIGVPREIECFAATGKPWVVLTDIDHAFALADADTLPLDDSQGLFDWVKNLSDAPPPPNSAVGTILFAKDRHFDGILPTRAYHGDAGYDLYVAEDTVVPVGAFRDVPCGVRVALPPGIVARIVGRSSTLRSRRLIVAEGTIDNGWRGPLFAGVQNVGDVAVRLLRGQRIAQFILAENVSARYRAQWASADQFAAIAHDGRGEKGFGSSGD